MSPKTKQPADPSTKTKNDKNAGQATAAFAKVVKQALDQFHEPAWLGEQSPLASPYFLGERLPRTSATAVGI